MKLLYIISILIAPTLVMANMEENQANAKDNVFNPAIGLVLNGGYNYNRINGKTSNQGFSLDETELNLSSNIDDKFYGSVTLSALDEGIDIEEAFISSSSFYGINLKVGRALWDIGYLNSHHAHTDFFTDRPLIYDFLFGESFNENGMQASYVLPLPFYTEIGGGIFGFSNDENSKNYSYTSYIKVGGDIGRISDFMLGFSLLGNKSTNLDASIEVSDEESDFPSYLGNSTLYVADYVHNFHFNNNSQIHIKGEYFFRDEEQGTYAIEDALLSNNNKNTNGFYLESVYSIKGFNFGLRYSNFESKHIQKLSGLNSYAQTDYSALISYNNSEFSTMKMQYTQSNNNIDELPEQKVMVTYVVALGAHGAHSY